MYVDTLFSLEHGKAGETMKKTLIQHWQFSLLFLLQDRFSTVWQFATSMAY